MPNNNDAPRGRTFWDFISEGRAVGAGLVLLTIGALCLCSVLAFLLMGYRFVYLGQPIAIERSVPTVLQSIRISNDEDFTAPSDGFIYVSCPNEVSCRVLMDTERFMTTGLIQQNQSAMFPVLRGQTTKIAERDPRNGDVHQRFFSFR